MAGGNKREKELKQQGLSEKIRGSSQLSRPQKERKTESLSICLTSLCQREMLRSAKMISFKCHCWALVSCIQWLFLSWTKSLLSSKVQKQSQVYLQ